MRDKRTARQLVIQVEMNSSFFEEVGQKIRDSSRIHLAGMIWHRAGEVHGADNEHTMPGDFASRLRESTISRLLCSKVDNDGTGSHAFDHIFGDQDGRALAWDKSCCDDDIRSRQPFRHHLLLLLVELFRLGLRIPALIFGILRVQRKLCELRPETLHLFLNGRARVVCLHDSAKPLGCAYCLQSCHACADDEDARGGHGAGCSHQKRKKFRQMRRRNEHRLVARNCAHGAQRVHRLSPRDPRHQFHRKRSDPALSERFDSAGVRVRLKKSDQDRSFFHLRYFIGCRRLDLEHDVGDGQDIRLDACALLRVGRV